MPLCFHILVITSNYFLVYFINNASMDNLALHQVRGIREVQSLVASGAETSACHSRRVKPEAPRLPGAQECPVACAAGVFRAGARGAGRGA